MSLNSRGLGRGLDALIPTEDVAKQQKAGNLISVSVNDIKPNSMQPRQTFSDESLADLANSIQEHGIIQPLIVVKADDGYELIAGERRLRAAKVIGLDEVPVIVKDAKALKKLELALVENIQRDNLNVIEEALAYQKLQQDFSLTQDDIARRVGKSRVQITNKIRLLGLPVEVKRALNMGQISEGHARAILGLQEPQQMLTLCGLVIARKLSVRDTEKKVSEMLSGHTLRIEKSEVDPNILNLEKELRDAVGSKVTIKTKRKGGSIVIDYTSDEEREKIINLLKKK